MSMVDEAMRDPISVSMLKTDGAHIMHTTGEAPGPRIGWVLHALLEEVLDDPTRNTQEYLDERVKSLLKLSDDDLKNLGLAGKKRREEEEAAAVREIREARHVS
jgi:hypothetical protein